MNGADWFIVGLIVVSSIIGVFRGFMREAISLVTWVLGLWMAWTFSGVVEPHLGGMLAQPLTGGEYVVNATSAAQNAALLEVLNSSRHTLNIGGGGGSTRLDASDIARLASALATAVRPAVREGAREGFQSQLTGAMLSIRAGEW